MFFQKTGHSRKTLKISRAYSYKHLTHLQIVRQILFNANKHLPSATSTYHKNVKNSTISKNHLNEQVFIELDFTISSI